jgi:hypothetical protein
MSFAPSYKYISADVCYIFATIESFGAAPNGKREDLDRGLILSVDNELEVDDRVGRSGVDLTNHALSLGTLCSRMRTVGFVTRLV